MFGRVEVELKALEDRIVGLEQAVSDEFSIQAENELLLCKQKHLQWLHHEEVLSCQKSHGKWLAEGDTNSAYFDAVLRIKKANKRVDSMALEDGWLLGSSKEVHDGAVTFF